MYLYYNIISTIIPVHTQCNTVTDSTVELSSVTVRNSTELFLGQTNIFLCIAEFQNTDESPTDGYCAWSIGNAPHNLTNAELYGCDPLEKYDVRKNIPLLSSTAVMHST